MISSRFISLKDHLLKITERMWSSLKCVFTWSYYIICVFVQHSFLILLFFQVSLLARLHHRNLVNLVGYCVDKGQHMLVYEYMSNGSLENVLYSKFVS